MFPLVNEEMAEMAEMAGTHTPATSTQKSSGASSQRHSPRRYHLN